MNRTSRRELLAFSGSSALGSFIGSSSMNPSARGNEIESSMKLKVIAFGAHPDDPETGCGGTMALFANQGHEVISAYLTRGEAGISGKSHAEAAKIRTAEALSACKI